MSGGVFDIGQSFKRLSITSSSSLAVKGLLINSFELIVVNVSCVGGMNVNRDGKVEKWN